MRRFEVLSIVSCCCLLTAGTARAAEVHQYPACVKQPSESEIQGAKGAFQAGNVSFTEADYERAVLYWEDAYRRDCTVPLLLHYLSRAYEGKGDLPQAVIALRTYLERAPNAPDRAQIERRIEVFAQRIEEERKRAEDAQKQSSEPPPVVAPTPVAPPPADSSLYVNPVIPLAVGGVGILAGVVGGVIYFSAKSDLSDAEAACPDRNDCPSTVTREGNDARSRVTWGGAVTISGLVLAGGGVGWYFFNDSQAPKKRAARTSSLSPVVSPNTLGLLWQGRF